MSTSWCLVPSNRCGVVFKTHTSYLFNKLYPIAWWKSCASTKSFSIQNTFIFNSRNCHLKRKKSRRNEKKKKVMWKIPEILESISSTCSHIPITIWSYLKSNHQKMLHILLWHDWNCEREMANILTNQSLSATQWHACECVWYLSSDSIYDEC